MRRGEWLSDLAHDVRYAARGMRRGWAFTLVSLLTLALGIGATTATFSVVNAVLLKPLSFPEAGSLVRVWERTDRADRVQLATSNLLDLKERSRTLSHLAGYMGGSTVVLGADEPVRAQAYGVTRGSDISVRHVISPSDRSTSTVVAIRSSAWLAAITSARWHPVASRPDLRGE